jgi:4-amino-4-deoxy-L-arabinose transferase-like glycosyltransferase
MTPITKVRSLTSNRTALLLLLAAIAIGIKWLVLFSAVPAFQELNPSDYKADLFPDAYDRIATNLIEGHGYRFFSDTAETTIRTPGFVLVLAGIFFAFGKSLTAVKAVNLMLSSITAWLVYRLGLRITCSTAVAVVAALLYFFYPGTILSDSRGGIETLFTFSIALFMLLLYRALGSKKISDYAVAGACFGAMMLVKSSPGLFLAALLIYLFAGRPNGGRVKAELVKFAVLAAAASLVMSPWIIRNAELTGRFMPAMSIGGMTAFQGLYVAKNQHRGKEHYELLWEAVAEQFEIAKSMGLRFNNEEPFFPQFYTTDDELRYYNHLRELAVDEFWQHPRVLFQTIAYNAVAFWFQGRTARATLFNIVLSAPFFVLALVGLGLSIHRGYRVAPLILFIGTFYIAHLPLLGVARYYIPLVPLISIFAAIALTKLGEALYQKRMFARTGSKRKLDLHKHFRWIWVRPFCLHSSHELIGKTSQAPRQAAITQS